MAPNTALVMTGGGARASYQVGLLRVIAKHFPEARFPIITGVSAGAINAAHLGNFTGALPDAVDHLTDLWNDIRTENIYRTDVRSLALNFARWGVRLGSGGSSEVLRSRALVDTAPLREYLNEKLPFSNGYLGGLKQNIRDGHIRAFAVTGTNYATGQTVTWVEGEGLRGWERPSRRGQSTDIRVDHIMASSALPLFFPAVQVGDGWFGDGGIRLTAPLAPALHLGAERILAISTRHSRSFTEANHPAVSGYPPPAQIIGVLLSAVFLDMLDQDAQTLGRINHFIEKLPEGERSGFRRVRLLVLRPSQDLGRLAAEFELAQPPMLRFLTRGLGTRETESPDWLSMILFEKEYIERMIEIGERDAEIRLDEIRAFMED